MNSIQEDASDPGIRFKITKVLEVDALTLKVQVELQRHERNEPQRHSCMFYYLLSLTVVQVSMLPSQSDTIVSSNLPLQNCNHNVQVLFTISNHSLQSDKSSLSTFLTFSLTKTTYQPVILPYAKSVFHWGLMRVTFFIKSYPSFNPHSSL